MHHNRIKALVLVVVGHLGYLVIFLGLKLIGSGMTGDRGKNGKTLMNKDLEKALFEKYPKIFVQRDLSMKQTCMCWGICCGDGWYKLIDELCSCLQFHIDRNGHPQIEAVQVKEKFGVLCFYVNSADDYQSGHIDFAEALSGSICEACGSMENVTQTKGWIKTRCKNCLEVEKG